MRAGAFSAHLALSGSRWRLTLAAVLAVAAVVVGLLTMHSMAGAAMHHETGAPATITQGAAHDHASATAPTVPASVAAEHHDPVLSVACDEACQMGCLMVGLICTLALLAVLVAFSLPRIAAALIAFRTSAQHAVSTVLADIASPRPPSLTALSISRT